MGGSENKNRLFSKEIKQNRDNLWGLCLPPFCHQYSQRKVVPQNERRPVQQRGLDVLGVLVLPSGRENSSRN